MNKKLLLILSLGFTSYNLCPPVRITVIREVPENLVRFSNTLRDYASDCTVEPNGTLSFDSDIKFSCQDFNNCIQCLDALAHDQDVAPLLQEQNLATNCKLLKIVDFFDIPQLYSATVTEIARKLALPTTLNEFRTRPDFMELFAGLPIHDIIKELKLRFPFRRSYTPLAKKYLERFIVGRGYPWATILFEYRFIYFGEDSTEVMDNQYNTLFTLPTRNVTAIAFSPDGYYIITMDSRGRNNTLWQIVLASIKGNTIDTLAQSLFVLLLDNSPQPVELDQAHLRNIFDTFSEREQLHILKTYRPRQNLGNIISNIFTSTKQHPRSTLVNIAMAATTTATALGICKLLKYKK